jgi:hypothetical protein
MKPVAEAQVGKDRLGALVGQIVTDVRNVAFPGCLDKDAVERQLTGLEAAVERLDVALKAHAAVKRR